jgi:hypothetical protein
MKKTFIKKGIFACIAAIVGIASSFAQTITNVAVDASVCTGRAVSITFTPTGFVAGTEFTAQLSDASGGFTAPVELGKGTVSPISGIVPSASVAGTTYKVRVVSVTPAVTGSISASIAVKTTPPAPTGQTYYGFCVGDPTIVFSASGENLQWYAMNGTVPVSGTPTYPTNLPVTGHKPYSVSQTVNGCESGKLEIIVSGNLKGESPIVTNPGPVCQNLVVSSALLSGAIKNYNFADFIWDDSPTIASPQTVPTPSTSDAGTRDYYVSRISFNGVTACASPKSKVTVTVLPAPVTPAVVNKNYTQNASPSHLTVTGTTGTVKWYETATNTTPLPSPPIPSTATIGTRSYYVTQTIGDCESARAKIDVIITAACTTPAAPVVVTPLSYTVGETATLTATAISGATLNWYGTSQTGGTASATKPVPSTAAVGSTTYYVSQSVGTCESPRSAIVVNVAAACTTPAAPVVVTPLNYTVGQTADLTATAITGATLNWYGTASTGGTASATKPVPSTAAVGSTTYYVSQSVGTCESPRSAIVVNIAAACTTPAAPVVVTPLNYTVGEIATLTGTAISGATLNWYGTSQTGGTASTTKPVPSTAAVGSTTYYVSQSVGTCESPRAAIVVNVAAASCTTPAAPVVVTPLSYTVGETATLTATAISGATLNWYGTSQTGGTASTTKPVPSTAAVGSTTYYVSQSVGTCESPRSAIVVNVAAACTTPAAPVVVTPLNYTVGQTADLTATAITGATLNWYGTASTGGTASATKPVPSTAAVGSTTYYVSQSVGTCESPRSAIVVNVAAACTTPAAPVVVAVSYCKDASAIALTATALTGNTLKWYGTNATGGTASGTAPIPSTTVAGLSSYYVSQITAGGCESLRAKLDVTINTLPAAPVVSALNYCKDASAVALTATALTGYTLKWYGTNETGGSTSATAPIPTTATVGTFSYYVSQVTAGGCESLRAKLDVTVNALPAAPVVTALSYCKDVTALALTSVALTGNTLKWYGTNETGGSASATAPIPTTATVGTFSYYVSQVTAGGCESLRAKLDVTVNALPATPVVGALSYCKDVTALALTSVALTGNTLKWYGTNETGGSASATAPIPTTATAGIFSYYVSQVTAGGCEGPRAKLDVTIKPVPAAPTIAKSLVEYCQSVTASPLSATPSATGILNWYGTNATGGSASPTAPTPSTDNEGTTSYYVGQTLDGCASDRAKIDVKINVTPKPAVLTPSVEYCLGATASPLSATGNNLKWYLTLNDTNPRTSPLTPFTEKVDDYSFYVTQTGTNTCESAKAEIKIHIKPLPSATISGNSSIALGQTATIQVNFTGDAPWKYILSNGQTASTNDANLQISVSPTVTTSYVVTEVSNVCGKGIPNGVALVTVLIPTITTGIPSVSQLCAGKSFTVPFQESGDFPAGNNFAAQISTVNDVTKFVSIPSVVNGSILTATLPDTTKGGNYFIRIVSQGKGEVVPGSVSSVKVMVTPLPVATISGPANIYMGEIATLKIDLTGDAPWTLNLNDGAKDTLISTSNTPLNVKISPKTTSIYKITTISNACGVGRATGTFRVQVDPVLGTEPPVAAADWLKIYPTMIENKCTVEITSTLSAKEAIVEIFDLGGRSLSKKAIRQKITEVDFSQKPSGMYLLKVQNGDRTSVQRIFKP